MPRELRWVAQYADGRIVREFEFEGSWARGRWKETPFWEIDLSRVISFGVEGSGLRVGFTTLDGIIGINGRAVELVFELPSGRFPLTGRRDVSYGRIVQYKEATSQLGVTGLVHEQGRIVRAALEPRTWIEAYALGWETEGHDAALGGWAARFVVTIPSADGEPLHGLLRFCCDRGLVGSFNVYWAGLVQASVSSALRPSTWHQIAMHFQT